MVLYPYLGHEPQAHGSQESISVHLQSKQQMILGTTLLPGKMGLQCLGHRGVFFALMSPLPGCDSAQVVNDQKIDPAGEHLQSPRKAGLRYISNVFFPSHPSLYLQYWVTDTQSSLRGLTQVPYLCDSRHVLHIYERSLP